MNVSAFEDREELLGDLVNVLVRSQTLPEPVEEALLDNVEELLLHVVRFNDLERQIDELARSR